MDARSAGPGAPYRGAGGGPPSTPDPPGEDALDERVLLWFLIVVGALRVGSVVAARGVRDGETSALGLVAVVAGRRLFALELGARRPR
jgi:hypothetical protein